VLVSAVNTAAALRSPYTENERPNDEFEDIREMPSTFLDRAIPGRSGDYRGRLHSFETVAIFSAGVAAAIHEASTIVELRSHGPNA
jgi:hypothetical protein